MTRILFVYKQLPAPSVGHAGGESLFRLMVALHQRGHRLTLVARITDDERAQIPAVEAICERVVTVPHHRDLPGPKPIALVRSYLALRRATARVVQEEKPDVVHVETTQTAAILLGLPLPPASFRTQDVNWFLQDQQVSRTSGLQHYLSRIKRAIFRWAEPRLYQRFDLVMAISEGDRRLLSPVLPNHELLLLPLMPAVMPDPSLASAVTTSPNLLFVGAMSRDHNINGIMWFLDAIWPRIKAEVPGTNVYIVGGHPPQTLRAWADGPQGEGVFVTGFVDDLAAWYKAADVFVAPMLVAGGLLQKVMDAMAMGTPVVATSVCNHGISAVPGEHLLTADTPEEFARAVVHLLCNPEQRQRLGSAGQVYVNSHYDVTDAIDHWDAALRAL